MAPLVPVVTPEAVNSGGTSASTSLSSASFTPSAGELLVVKTANGTGGTPSVSGGGLTWTQQITVTSVGEILRIYTAVVGASPSAMTVTVSYSSATRRGFVLERWPAGSSLDATPATASATAQSTLNVSITSEGTDSAITWVMADDNEISTAATYRSGAVQEAVHAATGNFYARYAYQAAAAPGVQSVGMTAPTGLNAGLVALEILPPVPASRHRGFLLLL